MASSKSSEEPCSSSSSGSDGSESPIEKILSFISSEKMRATFPYLSRTECAIAIEISLEISRLKSNLLVARSQDKCSVVLNEMNLRLSNCPPAIYKPSALCIASIQSLWETKSKTINSEINQCIVRLYDHSISLAQFSEKNMTIFDELVQSDASAEIADRKKIAADFQMSLSTLVREAVSLALLDR
jgi:hypothetical protein